MIGVPADKIAAYSSDAQTGTNPVSDEEARISQEKGLIASLVEEANFQPTIQPIKCAVLCDLRCARMWRKMPRPIRFNVREFASNCVQNSGSYGLILGQESR
jgi:hypothetical protein